MVWPYSELASERPFVARLLSTYLADSAQRPRFDLRPLALETSEGERAFAGQVGVEYKIYAPPDSGIYYICLTPSSQLFTLP